MKKKVEKENLITVLYCRLSVDDIQREDGMDSSRIKDELESNSITHQKQILEDYCKKEGIRNYRFFTDDGKELGAAKDVNGTASQAVSESIVIAKMGNQTIKIAVK